MGAVGAVEAAVVVVTAAVVEVEMEMVIEAVKATRKVQPEIVMPRQRQQQQQQRAQLEAVSAMQTS